MFSTPIFNFKTVKLLKIGQKGKKLDGTYIKSPIKMQMIDYPVSF